MHGRHVGGRRGGYVGIRVRREGAGVPVGGVGAEFVIFPLFQRNHRGETSVIVGSNLGACIAGRADIQTIRHGSDMHTPGFAVESHKITARGAGERAVKRRGFRYRHIHAIEPCGSAVALEREGIYPRSGHIVFEIHELTVLIGGGIVDHGMAAGREHVAGKGSVVTRTPVAAPLGKNLEFPSEQLPGPLHTSLVVGKEGDNRFAQAPATGRGPYQP